MLEWLGEFQTEDATLAHLLVISLLIWLFSVVLVRASAILIDRLGRRAHQQGADSIKSKRQDTVNGLLKNLIRYVIYFIMVVTILDTFKVPVMAILSTAGVLGVALAFGAQSLCRDMITGFFILLEEQYFVGEYIEAQGVAGYVEQFTMRCTYLRDFDGRLHILPNGGMNLVTNHHRGGRRIQVEVGIGYQGDIGAALRILQAVCDEINREFKEVIRENITALGVVDLADSAVIVRMLGQAEPMKQWAVERALRQKVLESLPAAGFDIPYPHTQVIIEQKGETERGQPT